MNPQRLVQQPLVVQILRRRGFRQDLQDQLRHGIVGPRLPILRYEGRVQIRLRRHHEQIRLHNVRRVPLCRVPLQPYGNLLDESVSGLIHDAAAHPILGGVPHVHFDGLRAFVVGIQRAVLVEFTQVDAIGPVVGIRRPFGAVFVGDVVGIAGIVVVQALNAGPPLRQMLQPPGGACGACRTRHRRVGSSHPHPHAPVGRHNPGIRPFRHRNGHGHGQTPPLVNAVIILRPGPAFGPASPLNGPAPHRERPCQSVAHVGQTSRQCDSSRARSGGAAWLPRIDYIRSRSTTVPAGSGSTCRTRC